MVIGALSKNIWENNFVTYKKTEEAPDQLQI